MFIIFICQRPSELCSFNKYWTVNTFGVRSDMKWNSNTCRLSNSMTNTTYRARMNGKQFRNNNGLLLMEFVFNVDDVDNQG